MKLEENNLNGQKYIWPLFELGEDEEAKPIKMTSLLGYVEHLQGDFYRLYDSRGEAVTIIDRKGILIRAIQKEAEEILKQLWSSSQNG